MGVRKREPKRKFRLFSILGNPRYSPGTIYLYRSEDRGYYFRNPRPAGVWFNKSTGID
jgi:hypothetical protein